VAGEGFTNSANRKAAQRQRLGLRHRRDLIVAAVAPVKIMRK
jgi:hypothetical protein